MQVVTELSLSKEIKWESLQEVICSIFMRSVPTVGSHPTKHFSTFIFKHTNCPFNIIDRRVDSIASNKEDEKPDPVVSLQAKFQELNVYLLHSCYTVTEFVIYLLSILVAAESQDYYWIPNSEFYHCEMLKKLSLSSSL